MVTFHHDFLFTMNQSHELYTNKMNILFNEKTLTQNLSMEEAEKLIEYFKEYKSKINGVCITIDKILNLKKEITVNDKIERELMMKMIPIMNVYRTLLYEKYTSYCNSSNPVSNNSESPESNVCNSTERIIDNFLNNNIYEQD